MIQFFTGLFAVAVLMVFVIALLNMNGGDD